jgi:hypothetical protein
MQLLTIVLKILSVIAIVAGFFLLHDGYPEGDVIMKSGILLFIILFVIGFIRVPRQSRGQM